jgi:predicted aldo/keto reductase-like oxidoreductase
MFQSYYYKKLEGKMFTKNGNEYPKFGVGGLRYRSEQSLKKLDSLEIGETIEINSDKITRVQ